jgi:hypothetical protein
MKKWILISVLTVTHVFGVYLLHEDIVSWVVIAVIWAIPYFVFYIPILLLNMIIPNLLKGDYYNLHLTNFGWALGTVITFILYTLIISILRNRKQNNKISRMNSND